MQDECVYIQNIHKIYFKGSSVCGYTPLLEREVQSINNEMKYLKGSCRIQQTFFSDQQRQWHFISIFFLLSQINPGCCHCLLELCLLSSYFDQLKINQIYVGMNFVLICKINYSTNNLFLLSKIFFKMAKVRTLDKNYLFNCLLCLILKKIINLIISNQLLNVKMAIYLQH